jgi:hypothetical protein
MGEQIFTMKSEVVGQLECVMAILIQSVEQKICERRRFTVSEVSCEFAQIAREL